MQCEICGAEAGKGRVIELDGSTLIVCSECAGFGVEKKPLAAPTAAPGNVPRQPTAKPTQTIGQPFFEREEFDLGLDIVSDFSARVRKAREQKQLTVQELAAKVFEKESVLHRIEAQAIKPNDALIAKLEKALGIKLKGE